MFDKQPSPIAMAACAAGLLFDEVLANLKESDSACHASVMRALDSGSTLTTSTSISRAGLILIDVALITPQGQRLLLASQEVPMPPDAAAGMAH